jgi:hypothetical protein
MTVAAHSTLTPWLAIPIVAVALGLRDGAGAK